MAYEDEEYDSSGGGTYEPPTQDYAEDIPDNAQYTAGQLPPGITPWEPPQQAGSPSGITPWEPPQQAQAGPPSGITPWEPPGGERPPSGITPWEPPASASGQDVDQDPSQFAAGVRSFAKGIVPTTAGVLGAVASAPFGVPAGPVGMVGTALAGGFAASTAAQKAQDWVLEQFRGGPDIQAAIDAKTHPWTTAIAGAAPGLLSLTPSTAGGQLIRSLSPKVSALAERGISGAVTGAIEGGQQAVSGEFHPESLIANVGMGVLAPRTRGWVDRVVPHGTPGSTAAAGVSEGPPPTGREPVSDPQNKATLGGTGEREAGGENLNTRDYGKDTQPTEPGAGVNVGQVDPTLAHALEQSTPELDAAVRRAVTPEIEAPPAGAVREPVAPPLQPEAPAPRPALEPAAPPREAAAARTTDATLRGPVMDARLDAIGAGGTAAAPGKLRETAAQLREQGQEGRAKQFEQAASSIERSQQQQQQSVPPSQKPTFRLPREQLVEEGKIGDQKAMTAAKQADTELHKLVTEPAGEQYRYKDLVKEAAKIHPEAKGLGGEKLYEAVTSGTLAKEPVELQRALKHFDLLAKESADIRKELVARGKIEHEPADPNYMHRLMKSLPERVSDPISEVQGKLPGMRDPSSTKELAFRGAAAKDGERLVLSGQGDRIAVMKNRTPEGYIESPHETGGLKTGDKITYNGKEYTVDRGREREIEQHAVHKDGTPVEYHKNAFASIIAEHQEMKMMKGYYDWLDNFKGQNSPFREYMTRDGKTAKDRGWKESEVPDLKGLYMHPNLEQAIHNNYNPGMKGGLDLDAARAINQFAVRSIFWNPVPHSMNALYHYVVGRGWDVIPYTPTKIKNFLQSTFEGFNSAIRQDQLLQDLNKAGASLVMSKIDRQSLIPKIGKLLETELKNNPGPWEAYARKYGLGKGIDAVKLWYDGAQRALWTFGDALMVSRIRELEMGGMSRQAAIEHTRVHMPDYRLPIEFLGSKAMVRFMSDNRVSIFGRYHMGMINSLSEMVTKTLGPKASMTERKEALGNVFALAVLGLVAKPALDNLAQMVTGNKEAETRPRGPLAPITGLKEFISGKKDMGQVLSNIFTLSPAIKIPQTILTNRDFAGRQVVEPGSPLYKKVGQAAEHGLGTMVSPYATFGPTVQPKTAKGDFLHELGSQVFDVKVPTARQKQGEHYGENVTKQAAEKRAKKPRGLLEYGIERLGGR